MIRCTLELIPGGISDNTNDAEHLGTIIIANDVQETVESGGQRGTYDAVIFKKRKRPWRMVKIRNFPRRAYHPWNLVLQILTKAAEENGGRL